MKGRQFVKSSSVVGIFSTIIGLIVNVILAGAVFFAFLIGVGLGSDFGDISFASLIPFLLYLLLFLLVLVLLVLNLILNIEFLRNTKKFKEKKYVRLKPKVITSLVCDGVFCGYTVASFFLEVSASVILPIINAIVSVLLIVSGVLLGIGYFKFNKEKESVTPDNVTVENAQSDDSTTLSAEIEKSDENKPVSLETESLERKESKNNEEENNKEDNINSEK